MPQNGETNQKSGLYKSVCCGAEIVINMGLIFPDCPNHRKLTTIWKPIKDAAVIAETTKKPESAPAVEAHIENRRLFNVVSGGLRLDEWEQVHLQRCRVCKGVLYVFVSQPIIASRPNQPKPGEAA
jgi:hypothetical protein